MNPFSNEIYQNTLEILKDHIDIIDLNDLLDWRFKITQPFDGIVASITFTPTGKMSLGLRINKNQEYTITNVSGEDLIFDPHIALQDGGSFDPEPDKLGNWLTNVTHITFISP